MPHPLKVPPSTPCSRIANSTYNKTLPHTKPLQDATTALKTASSFSSGNSIVPPAAILTQYIQWGGQSQAQKLHVPKYRDHVFAMRQRIYSLMSNPLSGQVKVKRLSTTSRFPSPISCLIREVYLTYTFREMRVQLIQSGYGSRPTEAAIGAEWWRGSPIRRSER